MKRFKRYLGVGLVAGLALSAVGVVAGSPAGASVTPGALSCSAAVTITTPAVGPIGSSLVVNPNIGHVSGPVWAGQGDTVTVRVPAGLSVLPSDVGGQTITEFSGLTSKYVISGIDNATANVTTSAGAGTGIGGGTNYFYDNDLDTALNPLTQYVGPGNAYDASPDTGPTLPPTVSDAANPLTTDSVIVTISWGSQIFPVGGSVGGGIFSPALDITIDLDTPGAVNGPVTIRSGGSTLTAAIDAPLGPGTAATAATTCAGGADPIHTINVNDDPTTSAVDPGEPLIACDPTVGTTGTSKSSKGWSSDTAANQSSSLGGTVTFDGCVAPSNRLGDLAALKLGGADAANVAKAIIKLKAKHVGNCTNVQYLNQGGIAPNDNLGGAVHGYGSVSAAWMAADGVTKTTVPATSAIVGLDLVVDATAFGPAGPADNAWYEANGTVSKGTGVGGELHLVAELDGANTNVEGILGCNGDPSQAGYVAPGTPVYYGAALPILTGADAVLSVTQPSSDA